MKGIAKKKEQLNKLISYTSKLAKRYTIDEKDLNLVQFNHINQVNDNLKHKYQITTLY